MPTPPFRNLHSLHHLDKQLHIPPKLLVHVLARAHILQELHDRLEADLAGAQPILGCISPSGASPELTEIMSEIVSLAAHLSCSGYCPHSRDSYYTDGMSTGGCLDDGVVGG